MKALNKETISSKPQTVQSTPVQQLFEELVKAGMLEESVTEILSKYEVTLADSKAAKLSPADVHKLMGKTIKLSLPDKDWNFHGELITVLYKGFSYPYSTISNILSHPDMSEEQREMLKCTAYEETKPKIYHRLVLNDKNQGILIIPYLVGVIIEQE